MFVSDHFYLNGIQQKDKQFVGSRVFDTFFGSEHFRVYKPVQ